MIVEWRAEPALPGPLTSDLTVSEATFQVDHLQVTSDAGSSGTTRSRYLLSWNSDGAPKNEEFPGAAVGLYSRITIAMIGGGFGEYAYRIRGTWTHDGETDTYEIKDEMPLVFGLDCNAALAAGGRVTLQIELDLKEAISEIDFEKIMDPDGDVEIHDGPELMAFRNRLKEAFRVAGSWASTMPVRPGPRRPHSNSGGKHPASPPRRSRDA